jgi:hypothetical protein
MGWGGEGATERNLIMTSDVADVLTIDMKVERNTLGFERGYTDHIVERRIANLGKEV